MYQQILRQTILSSALFLLFVYNLTAQHIDFGIKGSLNYLPSNTYSRQEKRETFIHFPLNDSTIQRTLSEITYHQTSAYISNPGYDLTAHFNFNWPNRISLRTGLGLSYNSYFIDYGITVSFGNVLMVDTIPYEEPIFINPCDCYENSYSEVSSGIDNRIKQEMINLSLPAELGYDIIPDKLRILVGAFFQTPLYSAARRSYVGVEMTTSDNMTKCKYIVVDEKNTAATGIRNFQWGISGGINYQILPKLNLELGVRQWMNDVYVNEELQIPAYRNNSFKPLSFSAGLSYTLFNLSAE